MMSILEQLAPKRPLVSFQPATVREFFVLRLAQKLGEPASFRHYAELARERNDETLCLAYRRAVNGHRPRDLGRHFHVELAAANHQHDRPRDERLLTIKVERRSIAVAVFVGHSVDFHGMRNLSSHADKAEASALGFVNWVVSSFQVDSATLERMTNGSEIRRAMLNRAIFNLLRASAIPVWEVSKRELLEAYGYPALRTRAQLRETAHTILWSMFNTDKPNFQELDAAALGLHVQTERLFLY